MTSLYMAIAKNQLCPCGSGKKYKRCCIGAQGDRVSIRINPVMREHIRHEQENFKKIMGRDMQSDDPLMTSLLGKSPEEVKEDTLKGMIELEVDEEIIYGFKKLGYFILDDKRIHFTQEQLRDWDLAMNEYDYLQEHGLVEKEHPLEPIVEELFRNL